MKSKQQVTMSAKNKAFWKLTPKKQAVAIAKDVLEQIKTNFLIPYSGSYFNIERIGEKIKKVPDKLDEVFSTIKASGGQCNVCGIGSCFVSLVNMGDQALTKTFIRKKNVMEYGAIGDYRMRPMLRKVFSPQQLTLIESAFEKSYYTDDLDNPCNDEMSIEQRRAIKFGERYKTDKNRLVGIMKNIIKNKGTFIP